MKIVERGVGGGVFFFIYIVIVWFLKVQRMLVVFVKYKIFDMGLLCVMLEVWKIYLGMQEGIY